MHRRGIQCLEGPAVRSAVRQSHTSAPLRAAQAIKPSLQRRPSPDEDFDPKQAKADTKRLIRHALRDDRRYWKIRPTANGQETRLRAKLPIIETPSVPSAEKHLFFAAPEEGVDDVDPIVSKRNIPPGSFVEIRRNRVTVHGVALSDWGTDGLISMISSGEIWEHHRGDVLFAIPDFASQELVTRCGIEEVAQTEEAVNVRVQLLRQIRTVEKSVELELPRIGAALDHALSKSEIFERNPDTWTKITATEAARLIHSKAIIPPTTLLCVHKALMNKPKTFVADQRDYLTTQTFTIRPLNQVKEVETLARLIYERDESVESFVEKARALITATRKKPPSLDQPASIDPNDTCKFTQQDQAYIRLLLQFLRSSRTIQKDPLTVAISTLVKRIDMYNEHVTTALVHRLLIDMGVLPPWDDPVFRDAASLRTASPFGFKPYSGLPTPPASVLGPEEFYPRDIVEDIRHDFGNLPVYVIDDIDAQELDDGISIEPDFIDPQSYWIHVHIADPTSLIHPDHVLAQQAQQVGHTLYCVTKSLPLLPIDVVHSGLSLGSVEGENKVMTFSFRVDKAGIIGDYLVRPGIVRNIRKTTYHDVNRVLGTTEGNYHYPLGRNSEPRPPQSFKAEEIEQFTALYDVASRLASRRADIILFGHGELSVKLLSTPPPTELMSRPYRFDGFPLMDYAQLGNDAFEHGARRIVAESMKGACRVASRFFRDRELAAIRRTAAPIITNSEEDLQYLLSKRNQNMYVKYAEILKVGARIPAGENSIQAKGHWQLGVPDGEGYVRVTSPLRRFTDMVAHWQIKHALLSTKTGQTPRLFTDIWLNDLAKTSGLQENNSRLLSRRDTKYWALSYIQNLINSRQADEVLGSLVAETEELMAVDRYLNLNRMRAWIPALGMQAIVCTPRSISLEPGEQYPVVIDKITLGLSPELRVKLRK